MKYDDITLFFLTCDSYRFLWEGFFTLFRKHFPDFDGPIQSNVKGDFILHGYKMKGIKKDGDWGSRTYEAIRMVKTHYIFIMLDDFYLFGDNKGLFLNALKCLKADKQIGVATLFDYNYELYNNKQYYPYNEVFVIRDKHSNYYSNLQPAIWRTKYFKMVVRKGETPWEFETYGTYRARHYRFAHLYPVYHGLPFFNLIPGGIMVRGEIRKDYDIIRILKREGVSIEAENYCLESIKKKSFFSQLWFVKKYYALLSIYITFLRKPDYD